MVYLWTKFQRKINLEVFEPQTVSTPYLFFFAFMYAYVLNKISLSYKFQLSIYSKMTKIYNVHDLLACNAKIRSTISIIFIKLALFPASYSLLFIAVYHVHLYISKEMILPIYYQFF